MARRTYQSGVEDCLGRINMMIAQTEQYIRDGYTERYDGITKFPTRVPHTTEQIAEYRARVATLYSIAADIERELL